MSETTPEPNDDAGAQRDEGYHVHLRAFDGPLDLLLHLVRINEVDITDIPIVEITRQYDDYIAMMKELDLEIAGEYLVMAATLMHIKSRMLLPPDPDAHEEAAEDPRAELVQQLAAYQRFKQAAENLQAMESRRSLIWTREDVPDEFRDEELLAVDMFDLLAAFRKLLGRLGEEERLRLKRDLVSVAEKIEWLEERLAQRASLDFIELLAGLPTALDRIATFLALLELMRQQRILAFQRKQTGEIRIARKVAEPVASASDRGEP